MMSQATFDLTILVVDDDAIHRSTIVQYLIPLVKEVYEAVDGEIGSEMALKKRPDLIISDIVMPRIDGLEMIKYIRGHNFYPRVIILSNFHEIEQFSAAIENKVNHYFIKPVDFTELYEQLEKIHYEVVLLRQENWREKILHDYRVAVDANGPVFRTDSHFIINYVNETFAKLLGFDKEKILGQSFHTLLLETHPLEEYPFYQSLKEKNIWKGEMAFKSSHSRPLFLHLVLTPLREGNDKNYEILGIGYDISELKNYQSELEDTIKEKINELREKEAFLIQQSKMAAMGEMLSAIAHQWRQPLSGLSVLIHDIGDAYRFDEMDAAYIQKFIKRAMNRVNFMNHTIDDFRHFYAQEKTKTTFDLLETMNKTLEMFEGQFRHNNIKVKLECGIECHQTCKNIFNSDNDDLEPLVCKGKRLMYEGYENELKQVFLNLLSNAQYVLTKREIADRKIVVIVKKVPPYFIITVSDNGGGIHEEIIDKVFDSYFSTKGDEGTGLGLYISKIIIEKHLGGKLTASNSHKGAEFTIKLPINSADIS